MIYIPLPYGMPQYFPTFRAENFMYRQLCHINSNYTYHSKYGNNAMVTTILNLYDNYIHNFYAHIAIKLSMLICQ